MLLLLLIYVFLVIQNRFPEKKKKSCILCLNFGESCFPGSSQILFPVKIVCVLPNPAAHFGQIPDPKNTLHSLLFPQQQLKWKMKYYYWAKC